MLRVAIRVAYCFKEYKIARKYVKFFLSHYTFNKRVLSVIKHFLKNEFSILYSNFKK